LKRQNIPVPPILAPSVFLAFIGEEARNEVIKLASALRKNDIGVIEATGNKSLKAQMRQANSLGVKYSVVIGEEEIKTGTAMLRNMATSQQETVPVSELPGILK
jgi:histidyl-tRNA synthetase